MNACSRLGLKGIAGTSGLAIRLTGASRLAKQRSASSAAISAPNPPDGENGGFAVLNRLPLSPVKLLRLQEDHRVRVTDRGLQQSLGVGRSRWQHDLQPWDVAVEGLRGLRVIERAPDSTSGWRSDHERAGEVAVRPVAHLGDLVHDLVESREAVVGELHLRHWWN